MKCHGTVLLTLAALCAVSCKKNEMQESTQAQSIRAKSAFGYHFGWGETHQLYFYGVQNGEYCAYVVDARNSEKGPNGMTVGKLPQGELFKAYAKVLTPTAISKAKLQGIVDPQLKTLQERYEALRSEKEALCEKVAEHRSLSDSASCNTVHWDTTLCTNPYTWKDLPGWAVCTNDYRTEECRPSRDEGCVPCRPSETRECAPDSGTMEVTYRVCQYSSTRDPDYAGCYNPDSAFSKARWEYETLNITYSSVVGEMNGGPVASGNNIRSVNEQAMERMRRMVTDNAAAAAGSTACPPAAQVQL